MFNNSLETINYDLELEKQLRPENFRDDEKELQEMIKNSSCFEEFLHESGLERDVAQELWTEFWSYYQDDPPKAWV